MSVPELQAGFIIHSRPFRDTSLILDLFTQAEGRLSVLIKGARGPKSRYKGLLQLFVPLLLAWRGRGELPLLTHVEPNGPAVRLRGRNLLCAMYLNELLVRVIHRHDPYPDLFNLYQQVLVELVTVTNPESLLRQFELALLQQAGYGLQIDCETETGDAIEPTARYHFAPEQGLTRQLESNVSKQYAKSIFFGYELQAIEQGDFSDDKTLRAAKRLLRLALAPLLGNKPIKSRELFIK